MLAIDQFPCEDADTQERATLAQVLTTVQPKDVWIADRNLCPRSFWSGVARRQAYFVIRQHQQIPVAPLEELRQVGATESGTVFEQQLHFEWQAECLQLRRIVMRLNEPTRHRQTDVAILTNLGATVATALHVADLYLNRWTVAGLFQVSSDTFACELNGLGYPRAALFSFGIALVAYNLLSVVKAALPQVHGTGKIEAGISNYYLLEEIQATDHGMMIAIPAPESEPLQLLNLTDFARLLQQWAAQVDLKRFASNPRNKKKPPPKRHGAPHRPHLSTARLFAQKQQQPQSP